MGVLTRTTGLKERVLRLSARLSALRHDPHMAPATGDLLDCHFVACDRPLCRSGREGHEPKFQRLGVNVLFGALILVVGGSLAGEWMGIQQRLGNMWFWFGSQGYEYVDLGRFWQILLFVGLVLWLVLMVAS